jgi:hypothetical protein
MEGQKWRILPVLHRNRTWTRNTKTSRANKIGSKQRMRLSQTNPAGEMGSLKVWSSDGFEYEVIQTHHNRKCEC